MSYSRKPLTEAILNFNPSRVVLHLQYYPSLESLIHHKYYSVLANTATTIYQYAQFQLERPVSATDDTKEVSSLVHSDL